MKWKILCCRKHKIVPDGSSIQVYLEKQKDITHINNANSPRENTAFAHLECQYVWL